MRADADFFCLTAEELRVENSEVLLIETKQCLAYVVFWLCEHILHKIGLVDHKLVN